MIIATDDRLVKYLKKIKSSAYIYVIRGIFKIENFLFFVFFTGNLSTSNCFQYL